MTYLRFAVSVALVASVCLAPVPSMAGRDDDKQSDKDRHGRKHRSEQRCETNDVHGDRRKQPVTMQVVGVNLHGHRHRAERFNVGQLRELDIVVHWPNFASPQTQRVELYNPNGNVYQEISKEITDDRMHTTIAVGGSWITQFGMYGPWCVEVYLDGVAAPVAKRGFVLVAPKD